MKTLFLFSCVIISCLATPLKRRSTGIHNAVHVAVVAVANNGNMIHKRAITRRAVSEEYVLMAFKLIDADGNGHITADEWAHYYAQHFYRKFHLDEVEWRKVFYPAIEAVDKNRNQQLEPSEFIALERYGERMGYNGK